MNHNPRFRDIKSRKDLEQEFKGIGVAHEGREIMAKKYPVFLRFDNVDGRGANILKQEILARGGEAAIAYDVLALTGSQTNVLVMGTISQIQSLADKLRSQPLGLKEIAGEIEELLEVYLHGVCDIELRGGGRLPTSRPHIMGVLNVTPDSFSDGGKHAAPEEAIAHGINMIQEGAEIIDVGGESTRPFSRSVTEEVELRRIMPVIKGLMKVMEEKALKALISVDTRKPAVAKRALEAGAEMLNDINALRSEGMAEVVADYKVPVVLMHMKGTPKNMQVDPIYDDVVGEILAFLRERIEFALESGIKQERIIVDPGIGFGKTTEHNLIIMNRLREFTSLGQPVLVGPSNKSFIGNILNLPVEDRLEGTLATVALSVWNDASIIRAHDVKAVKRAVDMTLAMKEPIG